MLAARLEIHLLGPFRLYQNSQPVAGFDQARLQHVLAYLVLHAATPVSRQQLAFCFWPDTPDSQAFKNLRTVLARLRQALPDADAFIHITPRTVQWRPEAPFALDVAVFEAALAQAAAAQHAGEQVEAIRAWTAAVAAYGGELLPDIYADWTLPRRESLRAAYGDALEQLVLALEARRDDGAAMPYAQRLVQHDPLHEAAYRHVMRLHLAQGNRTEALRAYRACTATLQREFGTEPGRATRELYEALRRMDDTAAPAVAGRPPGAQPLDPPLVGRTAEWARLVAAWRATAAGKAQLVLLSGEAGIGKTRLAEEFAAWVARQGAITATARCYPLGSGTLAYAPVIEWLRHPSFRPRLAALDDAWLAEIVRLAPALPGLAERPRRVSPGPLTEAWQRTRLFEALVRAVLGPPHAGQIPLLLFLDDLHWADRETLDWLVYLLHTSAGAPVLIVGTARGSEVDAAHPLTASRLQLTRADLLREIALLPLDARETALLAASVAGRTMEASEAAQIYHDTEGNPLFVVEMVRALATLATPPQFPPKVRAVIQWRLDMLSPAAQHLAQAAAVIGRRFDFDVLRRVSDQDEAAVVQHLDELWRRQLVRDLGSGSYDFSHDGIRAVVYDAIGPTRRRVLHGRVAQGLEALHPEDPDTWRVEIAAHYEQAGQSQQAIAAYRRAAAAAQRIYANGEAIRLYRHLLEGELRTSLAAHDRCALMLALGEVWRVTGNWARAHTINQQALVVAESLGDVRLQAQAQRALADVMHLQGHDDEALAWLARAEQGFESTGEWRGVVSALWTAGQIYWFKGEHRRARATLERQHQIATEMGDARGICEALETLGMVHGSQGDWEQSAACCRQAITIAETLEYKPIIARASITLGNVRLAQLAAGEAVRAYLRAGVLAREIDDRQLLSWAVSNVALILAKRGDYGRAIVGYESSLRNAWEIGDRRTACLVVAGLGAVNERLGRIEQAEMLYRKAVDFGVWLGVPGYLAGMLTSLAKLLLEQGRAAEAQPFYGKALAMVERVAGERLAGEDTRFDVRVLGIRLRQALGELTGDEARAEFRALAAEMAAPPRQAALQYELWRLTRDDDTARGAAAAFYRQEYAETGTEDFRARYRELTGETLPDPPPLPDVAALIPLEPSGQASPDLASLLAGLDDSFE